MASKRATLADVARLAGLSSTTASLILNGKPDTRFSADAHRRVHDAVAQLGYRPNMGARALRTDRSLTIGFISDVVATTRFASGLIRGALEQAEAAGHVVLVLETGGDASRESEAVGAVLDRQVDGIIFATMRARELFVPAVPDSTRVVMLNATSAQFGISVLPNEELGGRSAVDLLAEAGHVDGIALIGQNDEVEGDLFRSATVAHRVRGIRGELADLGLGLVAEESCWEWEPENGYRLTTELLSRRRDIRALLCMNDRLAFGAYQACQERGLVVGRDISVVSFDNDELAAYLRPGLTTIGLPHESMGRDAVRLLLSDAGPGERLVDMPIVRRSSIVDTHSNSSTALRARRRLLASAPEA
ncbi:LacI family DNA-binding transcriptional regulator [Agreia sp. COWG]|uniref:LacI family DNA-binding transcriptional regulator n=1 Tax=Agreia sp. COWG TaxID=2773266 RepID=UPI0019291D8D|nr:LacI family DNA-binding transcriptional regulator [Agreia sp. COWG]CAD6001537.1 Transcriptional regulator, LacI family [Agreia sp. COWG]